MLKKLKNWGNKSKRAETLLEVMVALVVMTIGSVAATTLILSAINANIYNKDALMALNLAQEGIEYMRNLRDTNWIRFSANRQDCWNIRPEATTCSDANKILMADLAANDGYALGDKLGAKTNTKLDLSNGASLSEEAYRLKYWDLDADTDSDNNNFDINGNGILMDDDRDFIGTFYSGLTEPLENTKFYRSINVVYKTINASTYMQGPWPSGSATPDLMQVYSTVQWMDGGIMHQIQLTSALSRYKK